jgi:hypothetical protein
MDFPQEETKGKKIVLVVLIFLFVLILGILGAGLYSQNKVEKNQKQTESVQEQNNTIAPAPSNVQEPSNPSFEEPPSLPDAVPQPSENERVPRPRPLPLP